MPHEKTSKPLNTRKKSSKTRKKAKEQKKQIRSAVDKLNAETAKELLSKLETSNKESVIGILHEVRDHTATISLLSRESYYRALKTVYASALKIESLDFHLQEEILTTLKRGNDRTHGIDLHRLLLKQMLRYDGTPGTQRAALSRDNMVLRYARRNEIKIQRFITELSKSGQGLDGWARSERLAAKNDKLGLDAPVRARTPSPPPAAAELLLELKGEHALRREGIYALLLEYDTNNDPPVVILAHRLIKKNVDEDDVEQFLSDITRSIQK